MAYQFELVTYIDGCVEPQREKEKKSVKNIIK